MMLGHTANAKKAGKFEDSEGSGMPRPRVATAAVATPEGSSELGGKRRRAAPPCRRPWDRAAQPKKPVSGGASAGAGAGSRVAELEAKLEKAHGQLADMREQLAAAEKARKEARTALVEAKKRFAAKKRDDVATSAVEGDDPHNKVPVAADVEEVANGVTGGMSSSATDVPDAVVPSEPENNLDAKADVTRNVIPNGDNKTVSPEVDELRAKLMEKDMEAYELRAKLMVRDTEVDELRETLMAKNTELDELMGKLASMDAEVNKLAANLMAKDADISALEADNADLTKMAEEAGEAAKATAARVRETEHALRESAAREARVAELLRASERGREALEAEAQRARVQSEQWRKAAEEAAVVLGGGVVDRATAGAPGGITGAASEENWRDSPAGAGERAAAKGAEEGGASAKRKSGGAMRVLSDMWRKKAQK
ncbi:hypothetical protein EJB05_36828, partial [Eragrostis curvula]